MHTRNISVMVVCAVTAAALVLVSASSAAKPSATGSGMPGLMSRGTLVVGMSLQFKPEMYVNSHGQPAGYDVDLLHRLAAYAHVKLVIDNLDFTGLIPGLETHKFDLVSTGLDDTPARAEVVGFTRPYVPYVQVVGIPKAELGKVTSTADLNRPGDTITALLGSTAQQEAEKVFPKAHIEALSNQDSDFLLVATGRANAIVVEDYLLAQYQRADPGELVEATLPALDVQYGSWAVPHGDAALINYLNRFLCTEERNGTLGTLYKRDFDVSRFPGVPAC